MPIPEPVEIFGINLHPCRMAEAVDELCDWIAAPDLGRCRYVVTPNVNHAVLLRRHARFAQVYADADFVLADGVPIVLFARVFGRGVPERVAGSDLVPVLFDRARVDAPLRVYLLGARPEVNERASQAVEARWPGIRVVGRDSPPQGFEDQASENARILEQIEAARPDVLVVGLGAPKQELWVHQHRERIRAKIALCVGATIDFLAGEKSRAPLWMRRSGLEWMHRVALEPRRLSGRYLRDGLALPGLVLREVRESVTGKKSRARPNRVRNAL
jgi:N-acetylglucosaminyldiphosphoundecaprenol N-acetyl-beta-D-mannosaminyltransferase